MGTDLLYDTSEEYKNKQLVFDFERGEVIDPETGVVIEDHLIIDTPIIRASDYAEWESKRQHEVLIEERDRRLGSIVYSVGKRINAPTWLCEDVINFVKKISKDKTKLILGLLGRNSSFSIYNKKFVLSTFYVVSRKRGLMGLAEEIANMDCGNGMSCYASRRRKDKEFYRYVVLMNKLWFILHRNSSYIDEVKSYIRYFVEIVRRVDDKLDVVKVTSKARELLSKYNNRIGTFKPRNFAAAIIVASIASVYGDMKASTILRELSKNYSTNETSVRNILRRFSRLENGNGGV